MKILNMNLDMTYCVHRKCIHRKGCTRSLGNYTQKQIEDTMGRLSFFNGEDCIKDAYSFLIRFRNSHDGWDDEQ